MFVQNPFERPLSLSLVVGSSWDEVALKRAAEFRGISVEELQQERSSKSRGRKKRPPDPPPG